jgi:hypothetical protein
MLALGQTYSPTIGHKGARYRRARAQCLATGEANNTPCYGCQRPIQYRWTGSPRHPLAPTAHHIVELWQGGHPLDPDNLAPCHYGCNSRLSNAARRLVYTTRREGVYTAAQALADAMTSRQW